MLFMMIIRFVRRVQRCTGPIQENRGDAGTQVKMLGRWHKIAGNQGFVLADSIDAVAIGKWMQEWTDLLLFDVAPVVNDEEVMKVLGARGSAHPRGRSLMRPGLGTLR